MATTEEKLPNGLTKLEHFTALAMQGILSNAGNTEIIFAPGAVATHALIAAKKTLDHLKTEESK